jgi:hypothetical protein
MNMQQIRPTAASSSQGLSMAALVPAAETEVELAKLDRKRSQDRLHQRRHRAKRKQQLSALEQDVKDLQAEVASLGNKRQRLGYAASTGTSSSVKCSSSIVSEEKNAARSAHALTVVREYFQVFKYGHSAIHQEAQEKFLRKVLKADVAGVDVAGVDAFAEQWRLYGAFFWSMLLESKAMRVRSTGDLTIVEVDADVHLRFRADLGALLCPQLAHHQELLQTIADNVICVGSKYTFIVEEDGQVSGLMTEVEFIDALHRVVGSLAKVAQVVDGAQISMCSGKISCKLPVFASEPSSAVFFQLPQSQTQSQQPVMAKKPMSGALNYRLQVNYLLSSSS